MNKNTDLTLLLTLKGREDFTLRWMWHANETNMPFHVIIADGLVREPLASILRNKSNFPNVSYEYLEYDDKSYLDFYIKCFESAKLCKTPFLKLADNDDFIFTSGVMQDINFLKENSDYVASQGVVSGFDVKPFEKSPSGVQGVIQRYLAVYSKNYKCKKFDSDNAGERVLKMATSYHPIYYAVFRKDVLVDVFKQIVSLNFKELIIHEAFFSLSALTFGKINSSVDYVTYFRQAGTSSNTKHDMVTRFMSEYFGEDLNKMIETIDRSLIVNTFPDFNIRLRIAYTSYIREIVFRDYQKPKRLCFEIARLKRLLFECFRAPLKEYRYLKRVCSSNSNSSLHEKFKQELLEIKLTLISRSLSQFILKTFRTDDEI